MNEECKPLTGKFIEDFLMEAQHRSGLPFYNPISLHYVTALSSTAVPDSLLDTVMEDFINAYMIISHELYRRHKTWKSYDW